MNTFLFILNEFLSSLSIKSVGFLALMVLLIFSFLALFSSLFLLGGPAQGENGPLLASDEVMAHLSPRLSSEATQDAYLEIRGWEEVRQLNFLFAQELKPGQAGGVLRIQARSPSAVAPLLKRLASIGGIVRIDSATTSPKQGISLSSPVRIGLVIGLALCAFASLLVSRRAFLEVLTAFGKEIRLMRLSGTPERTIQRPIVALGVLCGLLAGILLIVVVYLLHFFAVSHPGALLRSASGLVESGRVLAVSLVGLLLGLAMGALMGGMGASLSNSREFQPYS